MEEKKARAHRQLLRQDVLSFARSERYEEIDWPGIADGDQTYREMTVARRD